MMKCRGGRKVGYTQKTEKEGKKQEDNRLVAVDRTIGGIERYDFLL